jgi:hypothetical protein
MLPVQRNSFAERINPEPPAADSLSALAPLLRVRDVEVQDLCRFASVWRSATVGPSIRPNNARAR